MKKPDISDDFTIEDIHAIREYNVERRSKLSLKERLKDIKDSADRCEEDITAYKKTKISK